MLADCHGLTGYAGWRRVAADCFARTRAQICRGIGLYLNPNQGSKGEAVSALCGHYFLVDIGKKKVDAELAKLTAAKKAVEAEFAETKIKYQETEEKFKLLEENILTIDEDYFKNALNNAKNKYIKGEYSEATKILDNIIAIWQILSDDSELKKNITISEIINDEIPILKRTYGLGGGKRKINSSRTKRK